MKTIVLKSLLFLLGMTLSLGAVTAQESELESFPKTEMTWEEDFIDLGQVKKGETRETVFYFTNTGEVPVEIDLISACDCTTTDYPRKAILPGEKGKIEVVFDSSEKEEPETIDIDIFLKGRDPITDGPLFETIQYKFELVQ